MQAPEGDATLRPVHRVAIAVTALLVVTQLAGLAVGEHRTYVDVLLLAQAVLLAGAVVRMRRDATIEPRLAAAGLAALSGGAVVLTATVGLPGQEPQSAGPLAMLTLVLSVAVVVLVAAGRRRRTSAPSGSRRDGGVAV